MIIVEGIIQNHHIVQTPICFLWVLAEVLLSFDVLLVWHQVLIQVECFISYFICSCFVSEHFGWLIHFVGLGFAQRFSLVTHSAGLALVNIIVIERLQRMASCLRWSGLLNILVQLILSLLSQLLSAFTPLLSIFHRQLNLIQFMKWRINIRKILVKPHLGKYLIRQRHIHSLHRLTRTSIMIDCVNIGC